MLGLLCRLFSGCGAVGSARRWGWRGRKFKSCHPDHQDFIAAGGLAGVVDNARKKYAAWEKDGLLGDQSSGQ